MTRSITPEINGLRLAFLERRLVVDYVYPGTLEVEYAGGVRFSPGKDAGTVELGRFDHAAGAWFDEGRWTWTESAAAPTARIWVQNVLAAHEEQRSRSYEHDGELVLVWHRLPTRTSEQALLAAGFQPSLATWRAAASDRRRAVVRALLANEAVTPGALAREQTDDRNELKERAQHAWMRWFAVFQDTLDVGGRTYKVKGRPALRGHELVLILHHSSGVSLQVRLDVSKHPLRYPLSVDGSVTLQRDSLAWEDFPALAAEIGAVLDARKKAQRAATSTSPKKGSGRSKKVAEPVRPRELAEMPPARQAPPTWADRLVDAFNAEAGPQLAFSRRRGMDTDVFVIHAEERPDRTLAVVDIKDEQVEDIRWLDDSLTPAQQRDLTERLEHALAHFEPDRVESLTRAAIEKFKARALALGADPERAAGRAGSEEYRWLAETLRDLAEPRGTDADDLAAWLSARSLRSAAQHIREHASETPLDEFLGELWDKLESSIMLSPVERDRGGFVVHPQAIFESDAGPALVLREADADGRPRIVPVRLREDCEDDGCLVESDALAGGERAWHLGIEWDDAFIRDLYRKVREFEQNVRTAPERLADVREMLFWTAAMIDTPRCRGESRRVAEAAFRKAKEQYDRARALVAEGDSAEVLQALHTALRKIAEAAAELAQTCAEGQATLPGTPGELRVEMRAPVASRAPWQAVRAMTGTGRGRRPASARPHGQAPARTGRAGIDWDAIAAESERRVKEMEPELVAVMDRLTRIYSGGRLAGRRVRPGTIVVERVEERPEFPSLVLPNLVTIADGIAVGSAVALVGVMPLEVALAGWVEASGEATPEGDRLMARIEETTTAYHQGRMEQDEFEAARDALWNEAERVGVAIEIAWRFRKKWGQPAREPAIAASLPPIRARVMPEYRHLLELHLRQIPQDAHASVIARWVRPPHDHIGAGQGAWQNVLELPLLDHSTCTQCPFVLGSNLDCETCRRWVLSLKRPGAPWSAERIGAALYNCNEPAVAAAAARALAQSTRPPLTAAFFEEFSTHFTARLAELSTGAEEMSQAYLEHCRKSVEWLFPQPDFPLPEAPPAPKHGRRPGAEDVQASGRARVIDTRGLGGRTVGALLRSAYGPRGMGR